MVIIINSKVIMIIINSNSRKGTLPFLVRASLPGKTWNKHLL